MGYKEKDKTRLDEAKERARELIEQAARFEPGLRGRFGRAGRCRWGCDPPAARKRIDSLTIRPVNRPLNAAMGQVYTAVAECERPLHVVYVLTDLCRTSWQTSRAAEGLDQTEKLKKSKGSRIVTFILGVAAKEITNVSVNSAEPSSAIATRGEPIEIRGRIRSQGTKPTTRVVEFILDGKKKDEKTLEIPGNNEIEVNFTAIPRGDDESTLHQGKIRLSGTPDPYPADDERCFTYRVRPPLDVLIIYDLPFEAEFIAAALDPDPSNAVMRPVHVERVRLQRVSCAVTTAICRTSPPSSWPTSSGSRRPTGTP